MSLDRYEYVFDWAALIHISMHNPFEGEARGLRCFALPKRFSTHSSVRGHYLINVSATGGRTAEVIMLPALMQFLDDSLLDSLAIAFRSAENKK
eukprot:168262-Pleurochrysis_carterae.AAC.1